MKRQQKFTKSPTSFWRYIAIFKKGDFTKKYDLVTKTQLYHKENPADVQRYTYRVLQTIQMELILLSVWAERAVLDRIKTALKFKYEI